MSRKSSPTSWKIVLTWPDQPERGESVVDRFIESHAEAKRRCGVLNGERFVKGMAAANYEVREA